MNNNLKPQSPAEQIRTYYKIGHDKFRRSFKATHDEDTRELLEFVKMAETVFNNQGVNPERATALLRKHGVK